MIGRRSFFRKIAAIAAAVALAPEIAFGVRLDPTGQATINLPELFNLLYQIVEARKLRGDIGYFWMAPSPSPFPAAYDEFRSMLIEDAIKFPNLKSVFPTP